MISKAKLRENYINNFRKIQFKHRKNRENFIIIALLMAYFIEFIEVKTKTTVILAVPFLPKIKNFTNSKAVVNAVDNALIGKGKLDPHIKVFKQQHAKTIESLTNIIPQKPPKINKNGENKRFNKLHDDAIFHEESNKMNLIINRNILGKTFKQWNTQRDNRVRHTEFHQGIDMQVVKIDDFFQVKDYIARYPSDLVYLPPYDVYGCRCYLTYR